MGDLCSIRDEIFALLLLNNILPCWPLRCLSFFDLWIVITLLVCSNSCHYSNALAIHLKIAESKNKLKCYFVLVIPPIMGMCFYSDCDFFTVPFK
jgi:hypothetical protein